MLPLFENTPDDKRQMSREKQLKAQGYVRCNLLLPIEQNERLKIIARKAGKLTDQLIGELHMQFVAPRLDERELQQQQELKHEAIKLQEKYGPHWIKMLQQAASLSQSNATASEP